jgi:sarcosine oxidase subunit beta
VANFYHVVGMNGHGMTCHAGIAQATAEMLLRDSTRLDISAVMGHAATLDFSVLAASRFEEGKLLNFELAHAAQPS